MLVNLLENSLDACRIDTQKPTKEVSMIAGLDQTDVTFDIKDNGIGMDQETREKAFSLFFSSKGTEGTGLGLFISHKIVTNHRGNIEIESTLGRGTRFFIRFPRNRPEDSVQENNSEKDDQDQTT